MAFIKAVEDFANGQTQVGEKEKKPFCNTVGPFTTSCTKRSLEPARKLRFILEIYKESDAQMRFTTKVVLRSKCV